MTSIEKLSRWGLKPFQGPFRTAAARSAAAGDEAEQNGQPTDIGAALGAGIDVAIPGGRYRLSFQFLHTMALVSALGDGQHKSSATAFLPGFGWPIGQE